MIQHSPCTTIEDDFTFMFLQISIRVFRLFITIIVGTGFLILFSIFELSISLREASSFGRKGVCFLFLFSIRSLMTFFLKQDQGQALLSSGIVFDILFLDIELKKEFS